MKKKIIIIGAGEFGRETAWLIEQTDKYEIIGYVDDDVSIHGKDFNGYKVLGSIDDILKYDGVCGVIAIQNCGTRKEIINRLTEFDNWETLIHPTANVSRLTVLGRGCVVCANVTISVNTNVGNHCVFNIGAIVGHNCEIGDYVDVMSGVCIGGRVKIGERSYVATNATVTPGTKIGIGTMIGAGSVVIRNVKDGVSVFGNPAKILRL